jgi:hypothetical protein
MLQNWFHAKFNFFFIKKQERKMLFHIILTLSQFFLLFPIRVESFGVNCASNVSSLDSLHALTVKLSSPTHSKFRIAFIGDQGYNNKSRQVLQMIKHWNTNAIIHAGDFDYLNRPDAFEELFMRQVPSSTAYLAVIGNHDI